MSMSKYLHGEHGEWPLQYTAHIGTQHSIRIAHGARRSLQGRGTGCTVELDCRVKLWTWNAKQFDDGAEEYGLGIN
jgi:hypothetical protein